MSFGISKQEILCTIALTAGKKIIKKAGILPIVGITAIGAGVMAMDKAGIITIPDSVKDKTADGLCKVLDFI